MVGVLFQLCCAVRVSHEHCVFYTGILPREDTASQCCRENGQQPFFLKGWPAACPGSLRKNCHVLGKLFVQDRSSVYTEAAGDEQLLH